MTGVKRKLRNDWSARNCPTKNSLIEWTRPVYKGTNGSGLVLCKQGSFTADRTTVVEAAVDDQVVRIPLYRHNLNGFFAGLTCTQQCSMSFCANKILDEALFISKFVLNSTFQQYPDVKSNT
ncbi:unnamed protein product [Acanthoscelides obtectus]|uniref:Uncharacterized protein n=1 Tax=Acanthoscelides obtectus TaxID=200917 RepID=A0A9P0PDU7_ACAOB|nr:unnamed protein product [Acanthoscelides obtectus]CAK1667695.1 hypothetical protein AOBTE_LOCUS25995 [Acanthoscelides obtectus]